MNTQFALWLASEGQAPAEPPTPLVDLLHGDVDLFALFAALEPEVATAQSAEAMECGRPRDRKRAGAGC